MEITPFTAHTLDYDSQAIQPLDNEPPEMYLMFTHYLYAEPEKRTAQATAEAFSCSRRHIYSIMKKYDWKNRAATYLANQNHIQAQQKLEQQNEYIRKRDTTFYSLANQLLDTLEHSTAIQHDTTPAKSGNIEYISRTNALLNIQTKAVYILNKVERSLGVPQSNQVQVTAQPEPQTITEQTESINLTKTKEEVEKLATQIQILAKQSIKLSPALSDMLTTIKNKPQYNPVKTKKYMNIYENITSPRHTSARPALSPSPVL